jgi:3',5'-cyclic AMP phosphodiesterase CpdA
VEKTVAHISDLHVGRDAQTDRAARELCQALLEAGVNDVLITGDVTHRGRSAELAAFERAFAPLADRLVVVPGNHDRLGDDVARALMPGPRVQTLLRPGLFVIRLDSTAPHNRRLIDAHGDLTRQDMAAVEAALASAPPGAVTALMLHHHLVPLPEDHLGERLAALLGWPNASELSLGRELLVRLHGRCDLVLHGHRHAASELVLLPRTGRSLRVLNAGSTPELGRARLITHAEGRVLSERWLDSRERPTVRAARTVVRRRASLFAARRSSAAAG